MTSARLFHFYTGAWIVDCVLDLDQAQTAPTSGKCDVALGGVNMSGTIDPRNTGTFGPSAKARVVAGAGGWDSVVPRQDFHSDGGIVSTTVYQATAVAVGEIVQELAPVPFGIDFERTTGPAMRVFRDNPWWLDVQGVTHVGDRLPSVQDESLLVNDYDPGKGMVTFSCDTLVYPFTTLVDDRFGTQQVTVYDVEQLFDANGSAGWAWTARAPSTQLVATLKAAALEFTRANYLRIQRYRLILYQPTAVPGGDPRLALQAVTPSAGVPDIIPISPYSGLAGCVNELAPSQEVLVCFENADPTLPRIVGYSLDGLPLKTTIDASTEVDIGPSSPLVKLAKGTQPLALGEALQILIATLEGFATGLNPTTLAAQAVGLLAALEAIVQVQTVNTVAS